MHHDGLWENRNTYTYYTELILEMSSLCVDFIHHLHMLVSCIYVCVCMYVCVCVCTYVRMYVCSTMYIVHVYMYVYIYI